MKNKRQFRYLTAPMLLVVITSLCLVTQVVAAEMSASDEGLTTEETGIVCGQPPWSCPGLSTERVSCAEVMPKAKNYDSMDRLAADKAEFLHKDECQCGDNGIVCKPGEVPRKTTEVE